MMSLIEWTTMHTETYPVPSRVQDGKAVDEFGVHYLVLAAILKTPGDEDCFGWIDVYQDRLELVGTGEMPSAVLPFPEAAVPADLHELRLDAGEKAEQERDTLDRIPVSAPQLLDTGSSRSR